MEPRDCQWLHSINSPGRYSWMIMTLMQVHIQDNNPCHRWLTNHSSGRWSFEEIDGGTMKNTISQLHTQQRIQWWCSCWCQHWMLHSGFRHVCLVWPLSITSTPSLHLREQGTEGWPLFLFPTMLPQIIIEAKFTFDAFPRLPHVFTIIVFGDSWRMYWFPQNDLVMLYDEQMIYKDSRMVTCSIQQGHLNAQMP